MGPWKLGISTAERILQELSFAIVAIPRVFPTKKQKQKMKLIRQLMKSGIAPKQILISLCLCQTDPKQFVIER